MRDAVVDPQAGRAEDLRRHVLDRGAQGDLGAEAAEGDAVRSTQQRDQPVHLLVLGAGHRRLAGAVVADHLGEQLAQAGRLRPQLGGLGDVGPAGRAQHVEHGGGGELGRLGVGLLADHGLEPVDDLRGDDLVLDLDLDDVALAVADVVRRLFVRRACPWVIGDGIGDLLRRRILY